jgi:hypothetical protein
MYVCAAIAPMAGSGRTGLKRPWYSPWYASGIEANNSANVRGGGGCAAPMAGKGCCAPAARAAGCGGPCWAMIVKLKLNW